MSPITRFRRLSGASLLAGAVLLSACQETRSLRDENEQLRRELAQAEERAAQRTFVSPPDTGLVPGAPAAEPAITQPLQWRTSTATPGPAETSLPPAPVFSASGIPEPPEIVSPAAPIAVSTPAAAPTPSMAFPTPTPPPAGTMATPAPAAAASPVQAVTEELRYVLGEAIRQGQIVLEPGQDQVSVIIWSNLVFDNDATVSRRIEPFLKAVGDVAGRQDGIGIEVRSYASGQDAATLSLRQAQSVADFMTINSSVRQAPRPTGMGAASPRFAQGAFEAGQGGNERIEIVLQRQ